MGMDSPLAESRKWLIKGRADVPIPKVLHCYNIMEKLLSNILKNPEDDAKKVLNTCNKVIAEKVWSMPHAKEFFLALGYEDIGEGKMKYSKENNEVLREILEEIKAYKEKYEQIPEETLNHMAKVAEEEKRRREEIERLERQAELDRKDKSKEFVPLHMGAKDIKFGANEVVFKPPQPARKCG
eukprot:TRINITY_DN306_c0_g2_i6.p1 TRINITY_DN306_c0_g2~~TRINITY_DN306_c0_g2_i6.p1  ORF type:complete len:183 (-),score=76.06 TRINITY_DN306_c0_g2_i6:333-881(-)